jgi:ABC-2 type transport system permease protein
MSNTTTITPEAVATARDPGLGSVVRAEWMKFWSARSPRRNLLLGTVLGITMSALISLAFGLTFDDLSANEQADFDPLVFSLAGSVLLVFLYAAAAVNTVASENSSGMIRLTFTAVPRRERVLHAKMIVVWIATAIAGTIALVGMLGLSQIVFKANDLPTASLDGDVWRLIIANAVLGQLVTVLAVPLTLLLRRTAAALSATIALVFAPAMLGGLLPQWWSENVISLLPGPAADNLVLGHVDDSDIFLPAGLALLVVIAWILLAIVVTRTVINRRDA